MEDYTQKIEDLITEKSKEFAKEKLVGTPSNYIDNTPNFSGSCELYPTILTAKELSQQYDLGIGIARGGLWQAYICGLCGMPIKVVDMKRKGKGASYKLIDSIGESDIKDKRILFLDQDAVTGRTLSRAINEIAAYKPRDIGIFLLFEGHSNLHNLPKDRKIHFPKSDTTLQYIDNINNINNWLLQKFKQNEK